MDPLMHHISTSGGFNFEASNFTQVPLHPSCTHLRLKPRPLSNELAIVTALGQWLPQQSEKISLTARNGGPAWPEDHFFVKPIHAQEERNGPSSADQGLSTAKPRSSNVTWAQG